MGIVPVLRTAFSQSRFKTVSHKASFELTREKHAPSRVKSVEKNPPGFILRTIQRRISSVFQYKN